MDYLFQNDNYVKVIEEVKGILDAGFKAGKVTAERYNRAVSIVLLQGDTSFLPDINRALDANLGAHGLAERLKQIESQALRRLQPVPGMEGHHLLVQGIAKRLRNLPVRKALQVMDMYRSLGGGSGVTPNNLAFLSRPAHAAHLFKDQVSAHMSPILNKLDLHFFSNPYVNKGKDIIGDTGKHVKNFVFNANQSAMSIAETLFNEGWGPGRLLGEQAFLRPSEVKAREFVKNVLGGTDVFTIKDTTLLNKYNHVLNKMGINFNKLVSQFDSGKIPKEINPKFQSIVTELNANPKTSIGTINKFFGKGLAKKAIIAGSTFGVGAVGSLFDVAAAATGISEATDEEAGFGKKLVGGLRATSGVSGVASLSGVAAPVAVPVSLLSGVTAEILNASLDYHASGGRQEGEAAMSYLGDIKLQTPTKPKELTEEEKRKNKEHIDSLPSLSYIK